MSEDTKQEPPVQLLDLSEVPRMYADFARATHTAYDFHLLFALAVPVPTSDGKTVMSLAPVGIVYMSPQHAKALRTVLDTQISRYENDFGTIPETHKNVKE